MNNIVANWYENKENVHEMLGWNSGLKEWELGLLPYFPSGAKILDIGCGLGREAFEADDLTQFANQAGLNVVLCEKGR